MLPHHRVGWTRYPLEFGYWPCKNDIVTAAKLSEQVIPIPRKFTYITYHITRTRPLTLC